MKLRTKFGVILVVIMLVLSGVVLGSVELFKQNTVDRERQDVAETANLTAEQVSKNVIEKKGVLSNYVIRTDLDTAGSSQAELRRFLNVTDFTQAQVVAANGTVVGFWGDEVTADQREQVLGLDVSDAEYFTRAMDGDRFVELLGPSQVSRTDRRIILFSVPVGLSEQGEARGVFVAGMFVDVDRGARQTQINQSSDLFGSVVPQERNTQSVQIVGRNVSDGRVVVHRPHQQFAENLSASATVQTGSGRSWTLTVVRDRSTLDRRIARLQAIQFVGLLLVLGVVLGIGYWEYSMNLTQTEKLLDGFAALGTGDFAHRLSLTAAEEWEQIGEGFNDLATGLRERERAIREREQRLGVLNRVLRHNLQNDMNVILTYAELLPEMGADEQADAVETIMEKGTGLVAHGKKARQVEEAMRSAEDGLVEHDLSGVVEDILEGLRAEYPDATVESQLPETLPAAGIESLRYAVESISENALEHNDADDRRLTVSGERRPGDVTLAFEDNGPGIPEYEQRVVADGSETDLEHGSGLGLFLATWIAEKSNGSLDFEVAGDGGTTVTMTLPPRDAITDSDETAGVSSGGADDA